MEEQEVIEICEALLGMVTDTDRKLIVKKYVNFLDWFGMEKRLNYERVSIIDKFFEDHKLTVWCKRELRSATVLKV